MGELKMKNYQKHLKQYSVFVGTKIVVILLFSLLFGFLLILSPYILNGRFGWLYFFFKPYFLQLFSSKESMWVFFSFLIIPLVELKKQLEAIYSRQKKLEQAKKGLKNELESNLISIFAHNVDKPLNFYWFNKIDNELIRELGNAGNEWKLFYDLYKELANYSDLVLHLYKLPEIGKKLEVAGYQFDTMMKFANFTNTTTHLSKIEEYPYQNTPANKKRARDLLSGGFEVKKEEYK